MIDESIEPGSTINNDLTEIRPSKFAKAPPVADKGEFVSIEAHQQYANKEVAYGVSERVPVRPEVVKSIQIAVEQAWMANPKENPLASFLFLARYEGWESSEVNAALVALNKKDGVEFGIKREKPAGP